MPLETQSPIDGEQTSLQNPLTQVVGDIKTKVIPLIPVASSSRLSFRRVMFRSIFEIDRNKLLDDLCLDFFMQTTGWFDEIVIVKIAQGTFTPVYDFSLRDHSESPVELHEFEKLAKIGNRLRNGDWSYLSEAEGSDFDMVGRLNSEYMICVNNTNASIDELEIKYPNRIFEEVQPVIERTIAIMKSILSD